MAYPHHMQVDEATAREWQVKCVPVSEKYPQGRSRSVLRTLQRQGHLRGRASGRLRAEVFGVQMLCQVERAVLSGELPTERIVSIVGDGVSKPGHYRAPVGLPITELLARSGMYEDAECVVEGSSLAGEAIQRESAIVGTLSESYTVVRRVPSSHSYSCVRCGWCIDDCPAEVDPARLTELAELGRYAEAQHYGLFSCIECGICSYICPSNLPIMENIRMIKRKLSGQSQEATD